LKDETAVSDLKLYVCGMHEIERGQPTVGSNPTPSANFVDY